MMSSARPSQKYCCSSSELRFLKGRTAIERVRGLGAACVDGRSSPLVGNAVRQAFIPSRRRGNPSWRSGQSKSCAVCKDRNPSGGRTSSMQNGTRHFLSSPSWASSRTQLDPVECFDHATTMHDASSSAFWIDAVYSGPLISRRSHHTLSPAPSRALTRVHIRARSSDAYDKKTSVIWRQHTASENVRPDGINAPRPFASSPRRFPAALRRFRDIADRPCASSPVRMHMQRTGLWCRRSCRR